MTIDVRFDHLPHFEPKRQKVLAAILFLMREAAKVGRTLTRGEIVKSIFRADEEHFNECGRPVTFDNYVAMQRGPVGDATIDMLTGQTDWSEFGLDAAPWEAMVLRGMPAYRQPAVGVGLDRLSPSDEEFLGAALVEVTAAGFDATSEATHRHPAGWLRGRAGGRQRPRQWIGGCSRTRTPVAFANSRRYRVSRGWFRELSIPQSGLPPTGEGGLSAF